MTVSKSPLRNHKSPEAHCTTDPILHVSVVCVDVNQWQLLQMYYERWHTRSGATIEISVAYHSNNFLGAGDPQNIATVICCP